MVAKRDIAPGQRLEPEDVAIETRESFPRRKRVLAIAAAVTGKTFAHGDPCRDADSPRDALENSKDVRQGDIVEVEVQDGGAHLKFEARAEASGAIGDAIRRAQSGLRQAIHGQGARERPRIRRRVRGEGESMKRILYSLLLLAAFSGASKAADDKKKAAPPPASPLDRYVAEAEARAADVSRHHARFHLDCGFAIGRRRA